MVEWGRKKNWKTDEKHDQDCVKEGFQFARGHLDRDGEGGREAVGMGYYNINI